MIYCNSSLRTLRHKGHGKLPEKRCCQLRVDTIPRILEAKSSDSEFIYSAELYVNSW